MILCRSHWRRLRVAVHSAGLSDLIPADSRLDAMTAESLDHGTTARNFNPLLGAMLAIGQRSRNLVGEWIVTQQGCPICLLNQRKYGSAEPSEFGPYDEWLWMAADEMALRWEQLLREEV